MALETAKGPGAHVNKGPGAWQWPWIKTMIQGFDNESGWWQRPMKSNKDPGVRQFVSIHYICSKCIFHNQRNTLYLAETICGMLERRLRWWRRREELSSPGNKRLHTNKGWQRSMRMMMMMKTTIIMMMMVTQHNPTNHNPTRWESVIMMNGGNMTQSISHHTYV